LNQFMSRDYLLRGFAGLTLAWAALARASPSVEVQPSQVRPGDALLLTVHGAARAPEGTIGGRRLEFYPIAGGFQALAGLSVDREPGALPVEVFLPAESADGGAQVLRADVAVEEPHFRSKELAVAQRYIEPPPAARRRMKRDQAAFRRAFAQEFRPPLFVGRFAWPREASLTGHFGDKRVFNGVKQSQHYGDDIEGAVGDPVTATNDGKVVLARDCYASGRTVVVWHGARLYSVYFHLSRFAVRDGQALKRGDAIGLVGETGRVTGPHLHWGMKLDGLYVDPESILRLPFGERAAASSGTPEKPTASSGAPDAGEAPGGSRSSR
jgi:murein DD-endopeptidase MepM/ murein hydrolase activator NlpD